MAARTDIQHNSTFTSCLTSIQNASYGVQVRSSILNAFGEIAKELDTATDANATAIESQVGSSEETIPQVIDKANDVVAEIRKLIDGDSEANPPTIGLTAEVANLKTDISAAKNNADTINTLANTLKSQDNENVVDNLINTVATINTKIGDPAELEEGTVAAGLRGRVKYTFLQKYEIDEKSANVIELQSDIFKGYDAVYIVMVFHDSHTFWKNESYGNADLGALVQRTVNSKKVKHYLKSRITQTACVPATADMSLTTGDDVWHEYHGGVLVLDGRWMAGTVYARDGLYATRIWNYNKITGKIKSEAPTVMGKSSNDVPIDNLYEDGENTVSGYKDGGASFVFWKSGSGSKTVSEKVVIDKYSLGNKAKRCHFAIPYLVYGVSGISRPTGE